MNHAPLDRRAFLARVGLLGALTGASVSMPSLVSAATSPARSDLLVNVVRTVLAELSRDTINALAAFVVPGQDRYSSAQGTPRNEPGAMEANAAQFLIDSLDNYLPVPDTVVRSLASALSQGLDDVGLDLPLDLPALPGGAIDGLDEAVRLILNNDETVPLSLVVALMLNSAAVQVNPAATSGIFLSPFARLSWEEKARAFEVFESGTSSMVEAIDDELPEPMTGIASGMMQFIAGAILEFTAFGAFTDWDTFDPATKYVSGTPVGWELTGYVGRIEGWDEFQGYYQGREKVSSE